MSTHKDGVNPLRPYYIPPTIGDRLDKPSASSPTPNTFSTTPRNATTSGTQYASKARDMLNDLDYKGMLDDGSPTVAQSLKEFLDDLVWKYTSVLMAQPFEVAKTILQTRDQDENAALVYSDGESFFKNQFANQGLAIHDVSVLSAGPVSSLVANDFRMMVPTQRVKRPPFSRTTPPRRRPIHTEAEVCLIAGRQCRLFSHPSCPRNRRFLTTTWPCVTRIPSWK